MSECPNCPDIGFCPKCTLYMNRSVENAFEVEPKNE